MSAKNKIGGLQELGHSRYEIQEGQSDIRDWPVKDGKGKRLGWVKDLLFEESSRKVRYLVLNTANNEYHLEERPVLIPIGIALLHETENEVILPGITLQHITALPTFDRKNFIPESEYMVRNIFSDISKDDDTTAVSDDNFYDHTFYDERNMYHSRNTSRDYPDIE